MLDKIVVFMPLYSQYDVLHHFTNELTKALVRQGVDCKIIEAEAGTPSSVIKDILLFSPDCTLAFNGFLPDNEGRFLCDMIQIPHLACLVDSPNSFFSLANSPYTIVTAIDQFFCSFFQKTKKEKVLFMPHAVSRDIYEPPESPRKFDCVMLGTCMDPDAIRLGWKKYHKNLQGILERAAELTLGDNKTPYIEAFRQSLEEYLEEDGGVNPHELNYGELFSEIENYVRAEDRVDLLKALRGNVKVHVFGSGIGEASWSKLFPNDSDIVVHDAVPYEQAFQIMKQSKVVLNSSAHIKQGAHERIFTGLACGAAVLAGDNVYLREIFEPKEDILLYQHKKWKDAVPELLMVLKDEEARRAMVRKGYEKVKKDHTWDNRAKMLKEALPGILKVFG